MTSSLEYHDGVKRSARRSVSASLALFGIVLLPLLLASASAQINGVSPSVTSPGFGGRSINGTPPSVTSLGRYGYTAPTSGVTFSSNGLHVGSGGQHHRNHRTAYGTSYYPYVYAVPVPYAVDMNQNDEDDADDDANYQGGPTIFDRRGSGSDSYIPPSSPGPAHAHPRPSQDLSQNSSVESDPSPEPPQPPTTLVFKDGHQGEVENYAIVGQTLYDLTSGRPRKIALADLDLSTTQKLNEDRGVIFQLPPSALGN